MALRKAIEVEYSPELIYSYALSCVVDDKGVPRFMVKVFGMPLEENSALLVCRDFDNQDLLVSLYVKNLPKEIYEIILKKGHKDLAEWKKVLASILPPEFIPKLREVDPRLFSQEEIKKMIAFSLKFKEKIPKEKAERIMERILGPETFYDVYR